MKPVERFRILTTGLTSPDELCDEVRLSEDLVTEQQQVRLLIVVDADEDQPGVLEKVTREEQTLLHEREPGGVTVGVLTIDDLVVVDEALSGVVRRVDVDEIHRVAVRRLKRV